MEQLLAEKLGDRRVMFVRVGKRHIVNMDFLYSITPAKQRLILSDLKTFAFKIEVSKEALTKMKQLVVKMNVKR
jgi:DNA-binding LytR/AlgR family response regulator